MYVTTLDNDLLPLNEILIGDMKPFKALASKIEPLAYSSRVHIKDNMFGVHLVLSYTCYILELYLTVSLNSKMADIKICSAHVSNSKEMNQFFFTLYAAVHYLIYNPIRYEVPQFNPFSDIQISTTDILSFDKKNIRVFKHQGYVYKLFDSNDILEPNIELIRSITTELGDDAYISDLSQGGTGRFTFIRYKFIEGEHTPSGGTKPFSDIAKILKCIHSLGYVHGDIRLANLLFTAGGRGIILDFDLAEKDGVCYPMNYITEGIEERHKNAAKGKPRTFQHDVHALQFIIEKAIGKQFTGGLQAIIYVLNGIFFLCFLEIHCFELFPETASSKTSIFFPFKPIATGTS